MEKSVLIIDNPKNCFDCPCLDNLQVDRCRATGKEFTEGARIQMEKDLPYIPSWCPVREMPEYKMDWRAGDGGYESGWNDVLDKIGGTR